MTPKSKEELAEEYTNTDYFRLEYSTFGTTAKECQKAFLAGFQKSEEMHKELLGECETALNEAIQTMEAVCSLTEKWTLEQERIGNIAICHFAKKSINELLQKIRMRDEANRTNN